MKTYTLELPDKGKITYTDNKRYLWLASVFMPILPMAGIFFYYRTGSEWALGIPLLAIYLLLPALDWLLGSDDSNPPEDIVPQLEQDKYYRILTYITVPMHFIVLIAIAWFVTSHDLSIAGVLLLALTAGIYSGLGVNTAHELGHKKPPFERLLAKIVLAVPGYGHFCVEHNRGHHVHVSTPADPASSRMGESVYKFARREIPGAFRRGWLAEKERLDRLGLSAWSVKNEILQSYGISAVLQLGLIVAFGWIMIPFLLIHNIWAWFQLTSANYVEHYGLLRERLDNGRYQRCQPHHSWNANYIVSNIVMFHLERHSDHHANPTRRYQSLRNFDGLPELPSGYYGMFLLSYIPWLWYRVMDQRLLALAHIDGDLSRVNIDPDRRTAIVARYGSDWQAPPAAC